MPVDAAPGPGRPRAARSHDVAALALRMFADRGYDATTMIDIAENAGISRPTLFRYFPSKSDIVWDRNDDQADTLRTLLAAVPRHVPPLAALCDTLPLVVQSDATDRDLLRIQVLLVVTIPDVQGHAHEKQSDWVNIMADFVAERCGQTRDDLLPQLISHCVWTTGWTALAHWARSAEADPTVVLTAAYTALREGFRTDLS